MQGFQAYRKNAVAGWTRIEMLLAIYDNAIASLDGGIEALNTRDQNSFARQQLRSFQLLVLLLDGIDVKSGETASRIRDLCVYCIEQTSTGSIENWTSAREVLVTLREGFQAIREEANQLEATGAIPSLAAGGQMVAHL